MLRTLRMTATRGSLALLLALALGIVPVQQVRAAVIATDAAGSQIVHLSGVDGYHADYFSPGPGGGRRAPCQCR